MSVSRIKLVSLFSAVIISVTAIWLIDYLTDQLMKRVSSGELGKVNLLLNNDLHVPVSFWGSSTTLVHVSPHVVDSITGSNSFNFGLDGTLFQQYSGFLKSYAEKTTNPSVIVIGLNITDFHPRTQIYHPHYYTYAIKNPNVQDALKVIDSSLAWKMRWVPFYSLVLFDSEHYLNLLKNYNSARSLSDTKGYEAQHREWFSDGRFPYDSIEIYRPFVDNLIAVTSEVKKMGHTPVIFVSPMYFEAYDHIKNMAEFQKILDELKENQLTIINLLDSPLSKDKNLFYNYLHMNSRGAEPFSAELSHQIKPSIESLD